MHITGQLIYTCVQDGTREARVVQWDARSYIQESGNFLSIPQWFFVSKSLISVRVSMLHFIFKRLSSQENVIWNCSAINVLSYQVHVTWLANRKTFLKGFVEQNFLNRGHVASRFNLILSSPTVKQACTWPFHTFLDKLRNNLSIWLGNGGKFSQLTVFAVAPTTAFAVFLIQIP